MEESIGKRLVAISLIESQSAFAGYGMEEPWQTSIHQTDRTVAIRFRWIWDGRESDVLRNLRTSTRRNPLSLDMGWKS